MKQSTLETVQDTRSQSSVVPVANDEGEAGPVDSASTEIGCTRDQSQRQGAVQWLSQTFGLHISVAVLTILVDVMLSSLDAVSWGLLIPMSVVVAGILGFIVYKIQIKWYGDDHDGALIKALIVGLLTAIPVPLTPIVAIPGGVLGIVNKVRRR